MRRNLNAAIATLVLASSALHSAEPKPEEAKEKAEMTEAVNTLSECAGYFEFLGDIKEMTDPKAKATVSYMRDLARGAKMAASYMLSLEHHSKPGSKPKPLGDFFYYPDSRAASERTRIMALTENGNTEDVKAIEVLCTEVMKAQEQIIQQLRDDISGR